MSAPTAEPEATPAPPPAASAPARARWTRLLPGLGRWAAAVGGALVIFGAVVALRGADPLTVYGEMFSSTFLRARPLAEVLKALAPLALAALAVVVPARAGMSNVGGEGQVIVGAIAATGVALALDDSVSGTVVLVLMAVGGAVGGAAWAALAGLLRSAFGVNEAVSTLLLNFVALDLLLYLIYQPWRADPAGQPTSGELLPAARLPDLTGTGVLTAVVLALLVGGAVYLIARIARTAPGRALSGRVGLRMAAVGGATLVVVVLAVSWVPYLLEQWLPGMGRTRVTVGIVIALVAALGVFLALGYTRWGFLLSVVGGNAEAARRAGLRVPVLIFSALLVGGALAGLAGFVQFAGIELTLRPGFANQIGYVGFLASWLARHRPLPVLVAAFTFAALGVAADSLQLDAELPAATINILTALILTAVLGFTGARRAGSGGKTR